MEDKQKITVHNYQLYYSPIKDINVLVLEWGWKGFGQTIINYDTMEILDDECMREDFCKEVIKIAFEKYKELKIKGESYGISRSKKVYKI